MSEGAHLLRLAVGVFDTPQSLWRTVRALLVDGFVLEQLCLLAMATTASQLGRAARADETSCDEWKWIARLCEQVEPWPTSGADNLIVATSGPLLDPLLNARLAGRRSKNIGLPAEQLCEMLQAVRRNAMVLVVQSLNPAQQRLCTHTLLDQSPHSVMTYDFAFNAASEPGAAVREQD